MTEKLLTTAETCKILKVSRWTLLKWEESGELTPIKTKGGHRRYKESEVNRLMGVQLNATDNPEIVALSVKHTLVSHHS